MPVSPLPPAHPKRRLTGAEVAQLREQVRGVALNDRQAEVLRRLSGRLGAERGYDFQTAGMLAGHLTAWARRAGVFVRGFRGGGRIDGFNVYPTLVALETRGLVTRAVTDRESRYGRGRSDHWRITDGGLVWLSQQSSR